MWIIYKKIIANKKQRQLFSELKAAVSTTTHVNLVTIIAHKEGLQATVAAHFAFWYVDLQRDRLIRLIGL